MAVTFQRNLGMLVLAVWLILYGLSGMFALGLPSPVMAVLALVAGILIIVGRWAPVRAAPSWRLQAGTGRRPPMHDDRESALLS